MNTMEVKQKRVPVAWDTLGSLLFLVSVVVYAGGYRRDLFFRLQELSPLLPDDALSFRNGIASPGGLIRYAGAFLTRFYYYPLLGGAVFAGLLVWIRWLVGTLFRLPARVRFLSYLPSLLLLLSVTRLDHVIFVPHEENFLFTASLGVLATLLLVAGSRRARGGWVKWLYALLTIAVGYPLVGCYALFAALLIGTEEACRGGHGWVYALGLLAGVAAWIITCPLLYFHGVYAGLSTYNIFTAGLLSPADYGSGRVTGFVVPGALAVLAGLAAWSGFRRGRSGLAPPWGMEQFVGLLALLAITFLLSNRDPRFQSLMSIQRAVAHDRWEQVLEVARAVEMPDRTIILYRNVALLKQNRLGEEMFTFPTESVAMPKYPPLVYIAGRDLLFHHGRLNHAYRWAMEHLVQHGMTVDALRYMIKVALLNGEFPLAQKYVNTLERTPFYAETARKYRRYIAQPALMNEEPEFRALNALLAYQNLLGENTALLEPYLLEYYKNTPPVTFETLELSMSAVLTLKVKDRFWGLFPLYKEHGWKVPRHVQEAALLFAHREQRDLSALHGLDTITPERFTRFLHTLEVYRNSPEERLLAALKDSFGDTYWYYYFAMKELKTN
ncbi:MAG: DUF6057 family protein [Odoribacteraceae bacterium]|jgi:hypothetical protein|nr:DUF6057 family protein [Odoribacteraceae bacterium]